MDTSLNIKAYMENQKEFMTSQIINFYMEFSKNRLLTQKGTDDFLSCQQTMLYILNTLMLSAAPITIYTSQEIFYNMDPSLFSNSVKPKTVFQMPWPLEDISKELPEQYLNKTDIHDKFEKLLLIRSELKTLIYDPALKNQLPNGDPKSLEITVITESPDSDVATFFELLENDISSFFFDCSISIQSKEQSKQQREKLPLTYQTPVRTLKYDTEDLGQINVSVFKTSKLKCGRCLKYEIERPTTKQGFLHLK